ncbi:MAG: Stage V sporulation protein D [Syntrophus sp. PtaU1.Bin005]|jgi:cell division protein FtsI (penicillin-binding protein 3)|nr:MAG: Stage V sporulation protein D [Syntrophus sp. PtaB.Bin138]OPY82799.1 MAG: Stage V sporulation protein D [Syntrophus sp. PtaU1.Bin005]
MNTESVKWLRFRLVTLLVFFVVLFVALFSRAIHLQIMSSKALKELAQRQHTKTLQLPPERGIIFDRNGEKLAASLQVDSVCADPSKMARPVDAAVRIASILDIDRQEVMKKLLHSKRFCWIARRIPSEIARKVEDAGIEGIFLVKEPKRFYPNGELASQLVGLVGYDSVGLEGLEIKYDQYLKGTPEKLVWTRDAKGNVLFPRVEKASISSDESLSLVLTIDSRIQHLVESQLKAAVRDKGAKGGLAIVMDPKTGEILALANSPGFDPNALRTVSSENKKNRAVTDCFDPGSTFKPFLVAAALEEGAVRESDRFYCENGAYAIGNRVIHEAKRKRHAMLSVHDILKYSSNIGSVKIAEKLGKEKFYDYIRSFGFGARTGIDLPGEIPGLLRPVGDWTRVDAATVAFGQGISVTAIQLITALSTIANQGTMMKPYVVRALVDKKGQIVSSYSPTAVRRVISPNTARHLTAIMTDIVGQEDGTGKNARIESVSVAGKTGTSQKYDHARNAYSSERVKTSFMGFFPAEDPQVAILVILDEPQKDRWGGVAAAPVFKAIGEQILTCFKPHIRPNPTPELDQEEGGNMKLKLVSSSGDLSPGVAPANMLTDEALMPNFLGLSIRDVLRKAKQRGIEVKIAGNGWATQQHPAPGSPMTRTASCSVIFSHGN